MRNKFLYKHLQRESLSVVDGPVCLSMRSQLPGRGGGAEKTALTQTSRDNLLSVSNNVPGDIAELIRVAILALQDVPRGVLTHTVRARLRV